MKYILRIIPLFMLSILVLSFVDFSPKDETKKYISIEQAVKDKIVKAEFKGIGGYQGECIELNIKSLIQKDTLIRIEPGRHLVCEDSTLQDILIIKEIQLFLAAGETRLVNIFGFCCKAHNGAPQVGTAFEVGFMEDSTFIYLAEFLSKSGLPLGVMQNAVWVLSNNHSINSISNDNETDKPKNEGAFSINC
jgi:hypothetical protein